MKITTFDPLIVTSHADSIVKVFEELGFEKTHSPVTETEAGTTPGFRMKNADGFHVDIADSALKPEQDSLLIRMNVDDFEEAYGILTAHGFRNTRGDGTLDTKSATVATMVSPSGFRIALVKHIKK